MSLASTWSSCTPNRSQLSPVADSLWWWSRDWWPFLCSFCKRETSEKRFVTSSSVITSVTRPAISLFASVCHKRHGGKKKKNSYDVPRVLGNIKISNKAIRIGVSGSSSSLRSAFLFTFAHYFFSPFFFDQIRLRGPFLFSFIIITGGNILTRDWEASTGHDIWWIIVARRNRKMDLAAIQLLEKRKKNVRERRSAASVFNHKLDLHTEWIDDYRLLTLSVGSALLRKSHHCLSLQLTVFVFSENLQQKFSTSSRLSCALTGPAVK